MEEKQCLEFWGCLRNLVLRSWSQQTWKTKSPYWSAYERGLFSIWIKVLSLLRNFILLAQVSGNWKLIFSSLHDLHFKKKRRGKSRDILWIYKHSALYIWLTRENFVLKLNYFNSFIFHYVRISNFFPVFFTLHKSLFKIPTPSVRSPQSSV